MGLLRRKRKAKRKITVLVADQHAGHLLGLLNPATQLIDANYNTPYSPGLTEFQRYMWPLYLGYVGDVEDIADGCPVEVIHNGDIAAGTRYHEQLCAIGVAAQVEIAAWNMRPWFISRKLDLRAMRFVAGTPAHTLGDGSMSVLVSRRLALLYPDVEVEALYHALHEVQGVEIDVAHHGPVPGSRKWLEGNSARWYLKSLMLAELLDRGKAPRVVARAHYHTYVRVPEIIVAGKVEHEADLLILPSWSGLDDHARNVTKSKPFVDNGVVVLVFEDGRLDAIIPLHEKFDTRTRSVFDE